MIEQLDLFSIHPTEEWVFDVLKDSLLQVIFSNSLSPNKLRYEKGKQYSSIWYDSQMAFRICCRDEHHYFSISDSLIRDVGTSPSDRITKMGRAVGFTNYFFEPTPDDIIKNAYRLNSANHNIL